MKAGLTTPCSRPRIALLSCARLAAPAVECAAADGGRYASRAYVRVNSNHEC